MVPFIKFFCQRCDTVKEAVQRKEKEERTEIRDPEIWPAK